MATGPTIWPLVSIGWNPDERPSDAWAERAQGLRSPQTRRKTWAESTMLSDRSLDGASTKKWDSSSQALVHFWPIDLSAATLFSKLYTMYILVDF